jgi:LmbE family N-acetylglucosaminyl deacetylase
VNLERASVSAPIARMRADWDKLLPMKRLLLLAVCPMLLAAQSRSLGTQDGSHVALGLALRKLGVSGTFMQTAAHPDDEHNALYALFTHGMGLRSIDVQTTRGDGGQNEIGPELFRDIAVLRTSELMAAHRIDGAEQYFTRAIDYGYSFDPEEVIRKWGRQEIVRDFVRLIRTFRPDVLLTMNIQGRGGDRAHEATTVLTREAFRAAGDPARYPEQIREGLRPWQPKKFYFSGGAGGGGRGAPAAPAQPAVKLTPANTAAYDPLLARTYAEVGTEARSNHKCQGMGGLPALPGVPGGRSGGRGPAGYQLTACSIPGQMEKSETSMFDGIDTGITAVAQYAGPNPPAALTTGLNQILEAAKRAQHAFDSGDDAGTAAPVEAGLTTVRALISQLPSMGLNDSALYEINFRLRHKQRDYEDAVFAAHKLTFDAVADDGVVVAGQPVKLTIVAMNRGAAEVSVSGVALAGFDTPGNCQAGAIKKDAAYSCSADVHLPKDARLTTPYFTDDYWRKPENPAINAFEADVPFGLPFRPTPFRAVFRVKAGDVEVTREVPVQYRYMKDVYSGEKRMEVQVVPAFSVRVTPPLAVIAAGKPVAREVHVSVTSGAKGAARGEVAVELPAGWKAVPATVPVSFGHEDESITARFQVTPPAQVKTGEYTLRAVVTAAGEKFATGYQEVEYPHIQRRNVIKPAETELNVIDVKVAPELNVGYINGVGDQVPAAIEQLGARLSYIGPDELAWGDLSKYDVILTGVRAYERRTDLRAYNHRLLDYAERGGTVIVQYNKMEFNQGEYGPFPAKVSGNRVSDETVTVKVLAPEHPVFNLPNKIGPATWAGWVQERGLYFLGEKDKRYVDLISMVDSFPDNPGEKLGSLVEGKTGKGRWIYVGLALWRQLPAGTGGAYQLLANLISLPKL